MSKEEKFRNLLNFLNNPPSGISKAELFDSVLEMLKIPIDPALNQCPVELCGMKLPDYRPAFIHEPYVPTMIKIMESGIFYDGGLKGAENPREGQLYESHFIKDWLLFVSSLAMWLDESSKARDIEWREKQIKEGFSRIQSELSSLIPLVGRTKSLRFTRRLEKTQQSLTDLENDVLKAKTRVKLKASSVKNGIASIFMYHVKSPKDIMATRAAELLNVFDISATPEGMREYFKKK